MSGGEQWFGFRQFHLEGVAGGPYVSCRYLGDEAKGTEHGEGKGCKTRNEVEVKETTDLSAIAT